MARFFICYTETEREDKYSVDSVTVDTMCFACSSSKFSRLSIGWSGF